MNYYKKSYLYVCDIPMYPLPVKKFLIKLLLLFYILLQFAQFFE